MDRLHYALGLLVFLTLINFDISTAQGIQDFRYLKEPLQRESFIAVGLNRSRTVNAAAPRPENHDLAYYNLYLDFRHYRIEKGEVSVSYGNPLMTDLLLLLRKTFDNPNSIYRAEGSQLSSGPLGWLNLGWNLSGPGTVQAFAGFHLHDYFLTSTYVDALEGRYSEEPQGYYFSAGPALGLRAAASKLLLAELRGQYGMSYWRATTTSYAVRDDDYPLPHWVHVQADLLTKWGIFFSLQHHRMLNRGPLPNSTHRWDAILGFQVMI